MVHLRLFGAAEISGLPRETADELLAQDKRFAVLVYLLLARPRGYQRRDAVVAHFWAEFAQEPARRALRKSVHKLRELLGDGAIVTRGDNDVGVSGDRVGCDVIAFEQAFEARRYAEALELYRRGDLLPGFHADGAPLFGDWLDRQRVGLRDKAAAAAWGLAAQFAADDALTTAGKYARWAAELAPTDERMLRHVLGLLASLGDRAGALYVYDDFARRLRRDFEVEPSLETRLLVDRIRAEG